MRTRSPAAKPADDNTAIEEEQTEGVIEITEAYVFMIPEILGDPSDPSPIPSANTPNDREKKISGIRIL